MASIYDTFADSCAALAAKTKRESDKVQLLQLANQWRTVPADRQGPGSKPLVPAALASATENPVPLLARPAPQAPVRRPKSASDRIKDRKKQLESTPKRGKEMALVRAREVIGVLRELEIDDDAILSDLGFTAERAPKKAATERSGRKLVPLVSKQNGFSPTARLAAHKARQARADERAAPLTPIVKSLQAAGVTSLNALAEALNAQGVPTPAGMGCWHPSQVARILRRLAA
jgi:hypothetical protein